MKNNKFLNSSNWDFEFFRNEKFSYLMSKFEDFKVNTFLLYYAAFMSVAVFIILLWFMTNTYATDNKEKMSNENVVETVVYMDGKTFRTVENQGIVVKARTQEDEVENNGKRVYRVLNTKTDENNTLSDSIEENQVLEENTEDIILNEDVPDEILGEEIVENTKEIKPLDLKKSTGITVLPKEESLDEIKVDLDPNVYMEFNNIYLKKSTNIEVQIREEAELIDSVVEDENSEITNVEVEPETDTNVSVEEETVKVDTSIKEQNKKEETPTKEQDKKEETSIKEQDKKEETSTKEQDKKEETYIKEEEKKNEPIAVEKKKGLLLVGNSLIVGLETHVGGSNNYLCRGGMTVEEAKDEVYDKLDEYACDTVLIEYGTNEIKTFTTEEFKKSYQDLINRIYEVNPKSKIVLIYMPPISEARSITGTSFSNETIKVFNGVIKELCAENNLQYLDCSSFFGDVLDTSFSEDGVHLYSEYYVAWYEYMMERIK